MKKKWIALGVTLVMTAAMAIPAMAAIDYETARLRPDFTITIDGKDKNFKRSDGSAAFALVYEGSTYLPLRAIGEAIGRNVNWDEDTKTITLEGKREVKDSSNKAVEGKAKDVSVQVRKDFTIVIDGKEQTFRTSSGKVIYPLLYEGSTYLPLRAIGQIMGKAVDWDSDTKTVTLTSEGFTVTDADTFGDKKDTVTDADTFGDKDKKPEKEKTKQDVTNEITAEKAKEIALNHAGVKANQVRDLDIEKDRDDGIVKYEIDFESGRVEYEYEVDAETGKILKAEKDYDD
ncbi:MAG: PepSY domain-containing protein [Anaerotignum sp.]|nr:PepSY domain-containing protein [Anaerotignum sp.]